MSIIQSNECSDVGLKRVEAPYPARGGVVLGGWNPGGGDFQKEMLYICSEEQVDRFWKRVTDRGTGDAKI